MEIKAEDFAAAFKNFLDDMRAQAPAAASPLRDYLSELFGIDLSKVSLVSEEYQPYDLPNVQVALDQVLSRDGIEVRRIGIVPDELSMFSDLGNIVASPTDRADRVPPREGPMSFTNVHLDGDRVLPCVQLGMFLVRTPGSVHAYFVSGKTNAVKEVLSVQVLAREREEAQAVLAEFNQAMRDHDVYRGHILSVRVTLTKGMAITFADLPEIRREDIILPPGILDRLERQTVQFFEHSAALRDSGFHLKRGMLLHGPPGTGKTLTTMYLAGIAHGRTVILLSGDRFGSLSDACAVARRLQPSIVIMEDVDMVAQDRESSMSSGMLHELLNAMDGLEGDADIQFILTSNRAQVLERALAKRPGRVDLAVEIPLPDAECRRRLFRLYSAGVEVAFDDFEPWVERTDGASATYIRELIRRAALASALEGGPIRLETRHLESASEELAEVGGELNRRLLGFHPPD